MLATVAALDRATEGRIITRSPTIAAALLDHAAEIIVLGGRLFKHSAVASGAAAVEAALGGSADRFLLGVTGVQAKSALTTEDDDEAAIVDPTETPENELIRLSVAGLERLRAN